MCGVDPGVIDDRTRNTQDLPFSTNLRVTEPTGMSRRTRMSNISFPKSCQGKPTLSCPSTNYNDFRHVAPVDH